MFFSPQYDNPICQLIMEHIFYFVVHRNNAYSICFSDYVYSGIENPLSLDTTNLATFRCLFSLELYPWDDQNCSFYFKILNVKEESSHFVNYSFDYLGKIEFDEYYLRSWKMSIVNNEGVMSFKLARQVNKHILSTYVPTALLLIISYGTLYIPAESFTDRGTMSLTTLLVLVSLYTEALSSLPSTAYSKHIDHWYLFIIVYVSFIIAVHLITSNPNITIVKPIRGRSESCAISTSYVSTASILRIAQIVFAVSLIVFLVWYVYALS